MSSTSLPILTLLVAATASLAAGPNDWVNIDYVLQQAGGGSSSYTAQAQKSITSKAGSTAKNGPWSILPKNGIKPPSGDVHDYLSWAPYHWPDCNWCSKGTKQIANPNGTAGQQDGNDDDIPDEEDQTPDSDSNDNSAYESSFNGSFSSWGNYSALFVKPHRKIALAQQGMKKVKRDASTHSRRRNVPPLSIIYHPPTSVPGQAFPLPDDSPSQNGPETLKQNKNASAHTKRRDVPPLSIIYHPPTSVPGQAFPFPGQPPKQGGSKPLRKASTHTKRRDVPPLSIIYNAPTAVPGGALPLPINPPIQSQSETGPTTTTQTTRTAIGTAPPAQNAAKPQATKASKCTPSPTKSLVPSATWTTCTYVVRDGKVNPDTRALPGPQAAQDMPESVLFNGLTYALQQSNANAQNAAKFIDAFFLTTSTAMHPNMNFGQLVRGPGKDHQVGTFTGPLDMRGLVKVVNAIQVLKAVKSPDWTSARDRSLTSWMKTYIGWLQDSDIGKELAGKANNHLTFYVSQLSAAQIYVGDPNGAASTIKDYFAKQFKDQIAQSGEQPFEAVRTRPYHYRAFNLEAMITNAKIADQLGFNVWTTKSKYGATIQTAVDYAMAQDPEDEDVTDLTPHVAAVAAAFGDPKGKYKAFLQKNQKNYQSQPFWFYDQTAALPNSPAAAKTKREFNDTMSSGTNQTIGDTHDVATSETKPIIPFECPDVFDHSKKVEIEDGLFVTCDELAPYYKIPVLSDI